MQKLENCPVCRQKRLGSYNKCRDHTVTNEQFNLDRCSNCGFILTNPAPTEAEMGPYYDSDDYISHSNASTGLINRLYQIVRDYTLRQKAHLVQHTTEIPHEGRILDVGAGTGEFLATMQRREWEVTGLEPSARARNFADTQFDLKFRPAEELFSLPEYNYDAITLWHVLEHVHRLNEYADRLAQLIKPSGRILIAVPNPGSYDAGYYGRFWAGYDVPRHLWHFLPGVMNDFLGRHNLEVLDRKLQFFDAFYVSLLSESYLRGGTKLGGLLRAPVIGALSNFRAVQRVQRSSSLIYIVRRAPS
jgi:2-polyprenyl-3-methyl-5-hydroxy-6-metoxy-1,4-benzoquinol methylase